ncbi:glycerophosphoryl diester phosphodiesterase family protein [Candidatus Moduliflexus flocculans]|uniref:Glycerophosphoryl diester phosphodiesterase family protein n=1 Tax=Candidatus Moduliflexus flocculans TaxID=1499966 RepID=A0A0S6VWI9_9BACT|nr:glycerophosphoryl diester phosphodiesterase family protein [Candidatus Moduliflexus flocculans]
MFVEALRDFRRTWPQLILSDLLARAFAFAVLTPVVGLLFKLFLATTPTGVVTDSAIAGFLLHPTGFLAVVVVSAATIGIVFLETGPIMVIGFGAIENRRVTWLDAFKYTYRRVIAIMQLVWYGLVRLLLIALPFFAAIGALYVLFLRAYDINYYLANKPPVFLAVVAITGVLVIVMTAWMLVKFAGWLFALPMALFEGMGGKQAMRASERITFGQRRRISLWLIEWTVVVMLLSTFAPFAIIRLADLLIPREPSRILLLLFGLSAALLLSALANFAVTVFSAVLFPLLVLRLYRSFAGPGELSPGLDYWETLGARVSYKIPGKRILVGCVAALAVIIAGMYLIMRDNAWKEPVQIIAHRGGAAVAPENTMAAFKRGIADGADWIELDVQENADGVVVVEHDRDFMRKAKVNLDVSKATAADLASIDIGSYFAPEFSDQCVSTLREVLELAKGKAGVFIELKYYGRDQALEANVVDVVEQAGMAAHVVIMSLDYNGLRKMAALRPDWTYGLLNAVALGDLTKLDVNFLGITAKAASFRTIRAIHRRGMKVYAWTINDPVQMSVMMSRGVDGIITDQVALAKHVKDFREELTFVGRIALWIAGETGLLHGLGQASEPHDA